MYWKQTKGHHMSEMNHHYFLNLKNGSITLQFQRHLVMENIMEDYQHFKLQCILRVQNN